MWVGVNVHYLWCLTMPYILKYPHHLILLKFNFLKWRWYISSSVILYILLLLLPLCLQPEFFISSFSFYPASNFGLREFTQWSKRWHSRQKRVHFYHHYQYHNFQEDKGNFGDINVTIIFTFFVDCKRR